MGLIFRAALLAQQQSRQQAVSSQLPEWIEQMRLFPRMGEP